MFRTAGLAKNFVDVGMRTVTRFYAIAKGLGRPGVYTRHVIDYDRLVAPRVRLLSGAMWSGPQQHSVQTRRNACGAPFHHGDHGANVFVLACVNGHGYHLRLKLQAA